MKYQVKKYPNLEEEKLLWRKGIKVVVGLDEAGRGPLAGPVVAAAVVINPKHEIRNPKQIRIFKIQNSKHLSNFDIRISSLNIKDSKQLSQKQREHLFKVLTRHPDVEWGIGIVSEKVIDKINILEASKLAMLKAVKDLGIAPNYLLLDGNFKVYCATPQHAIIKGDQKVISISAASIIAKVTRDRIMLKYDKKYPQYGFEKHKGYGTALHFKMLKKHGACPIHRKTFYPVSDIRVIHN
ncbi:MAG: ribonuclease HII [Candidatus Staskawiczbacteria bacterium]|nr:ribonuclease HII [Candidatus Staskawiczbacteria bacterium]